jgi:hypothetical protein
MTSTTRSHTMRFVYLRHDRYLPVAIASLWQHRKPPVGMLPVLPIILCLRATQTILLECWTLPPGWRCLHNVTYRHLGRGNTYRHPAVVQKWR